MASPFTPDEIKALKRPFPLDKHTIREGHKEGGKIRWFVYIERSAVQDLLDELFPGEWETSEPKMYPVETRTVKDTCEVETAHEMSATMGITIRGLTRWDGGESDDGSTKSAITNAFRRTAAYGWGIARYLYDMDIRIKTDTYSSKGSDGRWQTDWKKYEQVKQQAWDQFTQWYNRQFGPSVVTKTTPISQNTAPSSDLAQKTVSDVTAQENAAEAAKSKLGTPNGQTIAPKSGKWAFDRSALLTALATPAKDYSYQERSNTVAAMDKEGKFSEVTDLNGAVQLVIARLATHVKAG